MWLGQVVFPDRIEFAVGTRCMWWIHINTLSATVKNTCAYAEQLVSASPVRSPSAAGAAASWLLMD